MYVHLVNLVTMILSNLQIAIKNLKVNKSRTLLTVLGIVIGIAAVITVLSAGQGIKGLIEGELSAFGNNWIEIEVKVPTSSRSEMEQATSLATGVVIDTLTLEDMEEIEKISNVKDAYAAEISQGIIKKGNSRSKSFIYGVSSSYIDIDKSEIAQGRFFSESEDNSIAKVAVLGSKTKNKFFGNQDAIGENIKIENKSYRVVGVMEQRGAIMFFDFDDMVYLPVQTVQKRIKGIDHVSAIFTEVKDKERIEETAAEIRNVLWQEHDIESEDEEDFRITTMSEAQEMINVILNGMTLLLIAIAAISLLVGGVGIMNVMYVAVVERTFEIGLRKSVGAKYSDIISQFLFEAMIITFIGGLIGFLLGTGLSFAISRVAQYAGYAWTFDLSIVSIILAISFSGLVGLVFGIYPAKKAADLNPIQALRYKK